MAINLVVLLRFTAVTTSTYAQITLPSAGDIDTVAGDGSAGYYGDGGAATSAELYQPFSVAVDTHGNIYIADLDNNRIREVTANTGDISTVAGGGTGPTYCAGQTDSVGDGCPATSAGLNSPYGVAVDTDGNIYIADLNSNRIREVSASTGIIFTVAGTTTGGYSGDGGPATSAQLSEPIAVALDSNGNIYIADFNNCRVREVTASTGVISTVAGDGTCGYSGDGGAATSAELNSPSGVAVGTHDNVYIVDLGNDRIREVTVCTGDISTVAGNGTAGYSGDGGAATSAELNLFWGGVAADAAGNIYIGDSENNRVREVTASGDISTVAGDGAYGFYGDGGAATSAEVAVPQGLAVDTDGNIYIADYDNQRIRAVGQ
ncbi:MAG: NHL repeat-containing protein [Candidatus Sulfotelmatobacter sp.]